MIHHLQHIVDLVEICRLKGIQQIVVSPGSRNAPLIKLFSSNNFFILHSIVDERSAAFYGLGIALAKQEPVALICTSGTAVLNYAPALAEAYYQRIPLIAITADRPEHLIDQQDNQTIRQVNVYQNFIKESIHLHQPLKDAYDLKAQHYAVNRIINSSIAGIKGPVHINVPIAEPLYVEQPSPSSEIKVAEAEITRNKVSEAVKKEWNAAKNRLVICGENAVNNYLNKQINQLAENSNTIVLAEPISNIQGEKIISELDRIMMLNESENNSIFKPDFILSMGGPVVSKRLKTWLQKHKNVIHYRISEEEDEIDTYQNLNGSLIGNPTAIVKELILLEPISKNDFTKAWHQANKTSLEKHTQFLKNAPYSDLKVMDTIINNLPQNTVLHLGNSSPVRYAQLFDLSICHSVHSNRGVSGIDGCLSTAAGFASQSDKLNLVVLGDLSFLYDSNGLCNSKLPSNLKIVVINNEGGGIFRLIPGPSEMETFEEHIEAHHHIDIKKLTEAFGVNYYFCNNETKLKNTFKTFIQSKERPALLEIKTPRLENAEIYKQYVKKIKTGDRRKTEDGRPKTEDKFHV